MENDELTKELRRINVKNYDEVLAFRQRELKKFRDLSAEFDDTHF